MSTLQSTEEMVEEFWEKFQFTPSIELQESLCLEELKEAEVAALALLKELCDLAYVVVGRHLLTDDEEAVESLEGQGFQISPMLACFMEALPDELVGEAILRVHQSNMSKLGDDGKPIRREDGKVLKGPNYREPILSPLAWGDLSTPA